MNAKHFEIGYATSTDDGVNYREIAEIMSCLGYKMNHSSARNYVIRVMNKFATELCTLWGQPTDDENIARIAKDPRFQSAIAEIMQCIEANRRTTAKESY